MCISTGDCANTGVGIGIGTGTKTSILLGKNDTVIDCTLELEFLLLSSVALAMALIGIN